jgi:hypothetical protein
MTDEEKEKNQNARTAYQAAANLYMQENSVTWARFNALVATNGIIVTSIGITIRDIGGDNAGKPFLLALFLPLFGLLLCFIWSVIMRRGFAYLDVWRDAAYQIERRFLREQTEALLKGDELSGSRAATVAVAGRLYNPTHRAPRGKARTYAMLVVAAFALLYLVAIVQVVALIAPDAPLRVCARVLSALTVWGR